MMMRPLTSESVEVVNEAGQGHLTFVFVAVIAGHEQDGGSVAVLDHGNRYVDHAVA